MNQADEFMLFAAGCLGAMACFLAIARAQEGTIEGRPDDGAQGKSNHCSAEKGLASRQQDILKSKRRRRKNMVLALGGDIKRIVKDFARELGFLRRRRAASSAGSAMSSFSSRTSSTTARSGRAKSAGSASGSSRHRSFRNGTSVGNRMSPQLYGRLGAGEAVLAGGSDGARTLETTRNPLAQQQGDDEAVDDDDEIDPGDDAEGFVSGEDGEGGSESSSDGTRAVKNMAMGSEACAGSGFSMDRPSILPPQVVVDIL